MQMKKKAHRKKAKKMQILDQIDKGQNKLVLIIVKSFIILHLLRLVIQGFVELFGTINHGFY